MTDMGEGGGGGGGRLYPSRTEAPSAETPRKRLYTL